MGWSCTSVICSQQPLILIYWTLVCVSSDSPKLNMFGSILTTSEKQINQWRAHNWEIQKENKGQQQNLQANAAMNFPTKSPSRRTISSSSPSPLSDRAIPRSLLSLPFGTMPVDTSGLSSQESILVLLDAALEVVEGTENNAALVFAEDRETTQRRQAPSKQ